VSPLGCLTLFALAFVGTHLAMSHPLRAPLVKRLGPAAFAAVYSLISFATLLPMAWCYGPAAEQAPTPLWDAGQNGWIIATILMWLGSVLFVGSLRSNPALPSPKRPTFSEPKGVFAITRHPMMWGFTFWAVVHAIVVPTQASLIISAAIAFLALVGAAGQDAKKKKLVGPDWAEWVAKTSFVPFGRGVAITDGFALGGGTILWLAATWAHGALGYRPAGIFAFFA
jgi:uncharacterized membrane protein